MKKRSPQQTTAFVTEARDRFKFGATSDDKQRQRELADLRMYAGEQWRPDILQARAGQNAIAGPNPMPPLPARPTYTINKLKEPIRQVLNQERQSDMGIEIVPADDFGDLAQPGNETEIELREGLVRRIQRESQAADARTWAFSRSTIAGRGAYAVMTRYLPGKTNDQEIYVHRIYNQASVVWDPFHEQPDGSDANWVFIGSDLSWDEYKTKYPKFAKKLIGRAKGIDGPVPADVTDLNDAEWRALGDAAPEWFTAENGQRGVRVVDYFYAEFEDRELVEVNGEPVWADELPDGVKPDIDPDTEEEVRRTVSERRVCWAQLDGLNVLDETEWPSPDIPVVKVLGEELQPYDKERRAEGMVRQSRDSQDGFNVMVSKLVEMIALTPLPPLQATPEQVAGFESWYQVMTTRTLPYLPYNAKEDSTGKALAPPYATDRSTDIAAVAASIQMFDMAIQATTGVSDPQLGKVDPSARSGKAIRLLQEQAMHGTSNYLDNLKRSIRYEGQIINNLLYPIYGKKPGRLVRIMNKHGESETIRMSPPSGERTEAGQANAAAKPGLLERLRTRILGGTPEEQPNVTGQPDKQYRLTPDANFNVIVKVTQSYESRRTQEAATIADLLTAKPDLMAVFGDLFFKNQDGPGHEEMAERAKVMLAPPVQQYLAEKAQNGGQALPPGVSQQMQAMQQQLQQAEQLLMQAKQEQDAKTAETQGKVQIEQIRGAIQTHLEQMKQTFESARTEQNNEVKLAVAEIGAKVDRLELFLEESRLVGARQHEASMADAQRRHELGMSAADAGRSAEEAEAGRAQERDLADAGHRQAMEQAEQAAALAPKPEAE